MKINILKALMLPIALLALGGINQASADTCTTASYTMTAVTTAGFSCTIGNLTFSNFDYMYDSGHDTGCVTGCTGVTTPDPTSDITVTFAETTTGTDPFGSTATAGTPIYSVITDYSAGNTVNEYQNETGVVQYLVTASSGATISEVDGAITGSVADDATGTLNKNICANNQFGGGSSPNGNCTDARDNLITATSDLALVGSGTQADGTPDFSGPFNLSTVGVYDGWTLDGATSMTAASATLTSVENDFVDADPSVPEPGTIVLFGSALVGLGLIRRRRKVA
jgi:hypothetical protein